MSRGPRSTNRTDPTVGAYNGFSLEDRGIAARWGRSLGIKPRAVPAGWGCVMCGQTEGLRYWHNEDYRTPLDAHVLCPWCHWALHARCKPLQAHVWASWVDKLRAGYRPPRCPHGTRWPTWAARYLRTDPAAWNWSPPTQPDLFGGGTPVGELTAFTQVVDAHRDYRDRPPVEFDLIAGAPGMPGRFSSTEATGALVVFDGFTPPLTF